MRRIHPVAIIVLLCLTATADAQGKRALETAVAMPHSVPASRPVAFVDVTVLPMTFNGVLEHQTVVTMHGRIHTVGMVDEIEIPEGAVRIVDLKTPGSGYSDDVRWENLDHLGPQDEVKFVLTSRGDYEWAKACFDRIGTAGVKKVLLSAAWGKLPAGDLARWMLQDRLDARLQIQLHKMIRCGGSHLK